MTKRQRIDAMEEPRLWVGRVVVPGVPLAASLLAIPEVRGSIAWGGASGLKGRRGEDSEAQSKNGKLCECKG